MSARKAWAAVFLLFVFSLLFIGTWISDELPTINDRTVSREEATLFHLCFFGPLFFTVVWILKGSSGIRSPMPLPRIGPRSRIVLTRDLSGGRASTQGDIGWVYVVLGTSGAALSMLWGFRWGWVPGLLLVLIGWALLASRSILALHPESGSYRFKPGFARSVAGTVGEFSGLKIEQRVSNPDAKGVSWHFPALYSWRLYFLWKDSRRPPIVFLETARVAVERLVQADREHRHWARRLAEILDLPLAEEKTSETYSSSSMDSSTSA